MCRLNAIILMLLFVGCNPVKKVIKHQQQFDAVGKVWALKNPCANDTVKVNKSDTVFNETFRIDTIATPPTIQLSSDTTLVYQAVPGSTIVKTITKTFTIHDTATNTVVDKRMVNLLQKDLDNSNVRGDYWKHKATMLLWILIASSILLTLLIALKLKL